MEILLYNRAASTAPAAPGAGTYVEDCPLQPGLCSLQAALGGWTHPEPSLMPGGSWRQEGDAVNMCRWLLFVHLVTQIVPLGICWCGEGSAQLGTGLPGQGLAEPSLCHSTSYIPSHAHASPGPGLPGSPQRDTGLALLPISILYLPAVSNKGSSTFAAVWGFL